MALQLGALSEGDPKSPSDETDEHRAEGTRTLPPGPSEPTFNDDTDSVFDPTTRRVSKRALQALVSASRTPGVQKTDPTAPMPPKSEPKPTQLFEQINRVRKEGLEADAIPFGRFTLLGVIGRGGMAEIRLATDNVPDGLRLAVIKVQHPELLADPMIRSLFAEEARISSMLRHPNIVALYDAGQVDGRPYMAFELIDGVSLRDLMRLLGTARLPLRAVVEIGVQAAAALAHAHGAKGSDGNSLAVVHRDVTPHNVLVNREGRVKLVDFGIARFKGREHQTKTGMVRGKLGYLAPEQCSLGPIDGRADVFALGLTLTELIRGERVMPTTVLIIAETESLIRKSLRLSQEPVPQALESVLVEMTSIDPADRIDSRTAHERLKLLLESIPGESLRAFTQREIFQRLPPLDFGRIDETPTHRVGKLAAPPAPSLSAAEAPTHVPTGPSPSPLSLPQVEDDEDEEDEAYGITVRRLRFASLVPSAPTITPGMLQGLGPSAGPEFRSVSEEVAPTMRVATLPAPPVPALRPSSLSSESDLHAAAGLKRSPLIWIVLGLSLLALAAYFGLR